VNEYFGTQDNQYVSIPMARVMQIQDILNDIRDRLKEDDLNPDNYIMQHLNIDQECLNTLYHSDNVSLHMMKHDGWIAVRGHNIELYGWDNNKKSDLKSGMLEIISGENFEDDVAPEEINFSLYDHKSKRSTNVTLADIEGPALPIRPQQQITTKGHSKFNIQNPDTTENMPQQNKSYPNQLNVAAQQTKVIGPGQNLWRGTSESIDCD